MLANQSLVLLALLDASSRTSEPSPFLLEDVCRPILWCALSKKQNRGEKNNQKKSRLTFVRGTNVTLLPETARLLPHPAEPTVAALLFQTAFSTRLLPATARNATPFQSRAPPTCAGTDAILSLALAVL